MFSSLYAEHAPRPPELEIAFAYDAYQSLAETQRRRDEEIELDERWEDEVDHLAHSTRLWSLVPELEGQGLLRRTSPADRLDNVTLRCELDYDAARDIARELRLTLDDYLYELTV
jgi:origin recognition complex subunit 5